MRVGHEEKPEEKEDVPHQICKVFAFFVGASSKASAANMHVLLQLKNAYMLP